MPAAAEDPFPGLGLVGGNGHHVHHLVPIAYRGEIEDLPGAAEAQEVAVAFDETGDREPAGKLDHLGALTDVGGDLLVAAHRRDGEAGHRDGFGIAEGRVHRGHLAAAQHQVGGRHGRCFSRRVVRWFGWAAAGQRQRRKGGYDDPADKLVYCRHVASESVRVEAGTLAPAGRERKPGPQRGSAGRSPGQTTGRSLGAR
jgi:hypothetical protein